LGKYGCIGNEGLEKKEKSESNWPPQGPSSGDNIELRSLINKKQVTKGTFLNSNGCFSNGFPEGSRIGMQSAGCHKKAYMPLFCYA
jgi:hypothetical protein